MFEFRVEEVQYISNKITSCEKVKLSQNIVNLYSNFGLMKYLRVVYPTHFK